MLAPGWQERLHPLKNENTQNKTGWCLDVADLAAAKLVAYRDKDRDFVRILLRERMIDAATLIKRVSEVPLEEEALRSRLKAWIARTVKELGQ